MFKLTTQQREYMLIREGVDAAKTNRFILEPPYSLERVHIAIAKPLNVYAKPPHKIHLIRKQNLDRDQRRLPANE